MKRRAWLGLAVIGCVAPISLSAQESRIVSPPSASSQVVPTKPAEPGLKPTVVQEGTTGVSPTVVGESYDGEYVPSFSERMYGLRDILVRPFSFG